MVAWDRTTGRPVHRALVWQDRRTAARCEALQAMPDVDALVRARTGLVVDPYFSATKLEWLLGEGGVAASPSLALGTVDTWILWHLTGGPAGGVHATEASNASRTLLLDIDTCTWSEELCDLFGVPRHLLPEVRSSCGRFGTTVPDAAAGLTVPVSGIAGDQQAALFGQACFDTGMAKNTYGTGSFVLVNTGATRPPPVDGLLTTVAWTHGDEVTYALEGSIFVTGAAIQWLRDGLGVLETAADAGPLAASVPDTGGVVFVPALTGLGAPWWDPYRARRDRRDHPGRDARRTSRAPRWRRWRGRPPTWSTPSVAPVSCRSPSCGSTAAPSAMDLLCQFQADVLGLPVRRSRVRESTALGAAFLAGIAEGVWATPDDAARAWQADATFEPAYLPDRDRRSGEWHRAVDRTRLGPMTAGGVRRSGPPGGDVTPGRAAAG